VSGVQAPLRDGEGRLTGYAKIARDLTERKKLEDALKRAHDELEGRVRERTLELAETNVSLEAEVRERRAAEEQIKRLLKQLVNVQEDERLRIARDIHDHLGQQMTGLRLNLELLRKQCADDSELCSRVEQTQAVAQKLDEDVDFLAWELRPAALEDLGLAPALATFVNDWSKHFDISAELHTSGMDGVRLPPDVEINLYRILQEALNNIAKHAEAASVSVLLERKGNELMLIVEDDGRGFDPEKKVYEEGGKGLGLVGMRERAQLAGGSAEIESTPGGGTTILVRVRPARSEEGGAQE
jgi:signal transduction histidine kinase